MTRTPYNIPFFVIGNPRSGTTLLRLMLNNHPQLSVPPECGFALWLHKKYAGLSFDSEDVISQFVSDVYTTRKFETWGIEKDSLREFIFATKVRSYPELVSAVYYSYAHDRNKYPVLVGDKNNYHIEHIRDLKKVFGNPKIVFLVRDGRDVACSYRELSLKHISSKYAPNLPDTIESIAYEWKVNNDNILKEASENSLLISYEDLVTNSGNILEQICNFLGIEYNQSMLGYQKNNDEPEEFLQWKSKTMEAPDSSQIGRHKYDLSSEEICRFQAIAGATLDALGYKDMHC